mmetsp:Transcript_31310/g.79747  ORF Transcript_31310/g.79747 Transcript_31310/m.79747 type:complete len:249 (+) Transcript_31310:356-1102(+)
MNFSMKFMNSSKSMYSNCVRSSAILSIPSFFVITWPRYSTSGFRSSLCRSDSPGSLNLSKPFLILTTSRSEKPSTSPRPIISTRSASSSMALSSSCGPLSFSAAASSVGGKPLSGPASSGRGMTPTGSLPPKRLMLRAMPGDIGCWLPLSLSASPGTEASAWVAHALSCGLASGASPPGDALSCLFTACRICRSAEPRPVPDLEEASSIDGLRAGNAGSDELGRMRCRPQPPMRSPADFFETRTFAVA